MAVSASALQVVAPEDLAALRSLEVQFAQRHSAFLIDFFGRGWSARELKLKSHDGALRTRPGESRHYFCTVLNRWYWDPSNYVYSRCLRSLMRQMPPCYLVEHWQQLNAEHQGDVCEAILGMGWKDETIVGPDPESPYQLVAKDLEEIVRLSMHVHR